MIPTSLTMFLLVCHAAGAPKVRFIIVTGRHNLHTYPYVEDRGYLLKVMYQILMRPITTGDFKICALLTCYAVYSGNSVSTFVDNLSVSPSKIKKSNNNSLFNVYWTVHHCNS